MALEGGCLLSALGRWEGDWGLSFVGLGVLGGRWSIVVLGGQVGGVELVVAYMREWGEGMSFVDLGSGVGSCLPLRSHAW